MKKFFFLILAFVFAFCVMPFSSACNQNSQEELTESNRSISPTEDLTFVYKEVSKNGSIEKGYYVDVYTGTSTVIGIPDYYNKLPVIGIVERAFANMEKIDAISFPKSLNRIANMKNAFVGDNPSGYCDVIETIEVYADYAGNLPKYLAQNVVNLYIFDGEKISASAFNGNNNLKTLKLAEGLITIESQAFKNCSSLKDLVFPSTLETVGNNAFEGVNATTIVFSKPSNLKSVASAAFNQIDSCKKLYYGYKTSKDDWKKINIEKTYYNLNRGFENADVFVPY